MKLYSILLSLANRKVSMLDAYPVGSIYMSVNSTSPENLFGGGTWVQIKDRFLLAAGDTYAAGGTGGSATHTPSGTVNGHALTTDQIPSHEHQLNIYAENSGNTRAGYVAFSDTASGATYVARSTGGGQAHTHGFTGESQNTLPPYMTVYVWKRTA